jgi:tRNA threonylcarbamoyladenosine biosynthesis protein TsaB
MTGTWLGIETTTSTGGVAVLRDGLLLAEECFPVRATHSEKVLPGVSRLLEQAEVDGSEITGIAVSSGPGSYTGLRIGIATACGLSSGWGIGAVGVETLRVLAYSVSARCPVLACIKARNKEVYAAIYEDSASDACEIVRPGVYTACAIEKKLSEFDDVVAVGNGRNAISFSSTVREADQLWDTPRPSIVAVIGSIKAGSVGFDEHPAPVYLRGFNEKADSFVP